MPDMASRSREQAVVGESVLVRIVDGVFGLGAVARNTGNGSKHEKEAKVYRCK